jgi:hypothetical protein
MKYPTFMVRGLPTPNDKLMLCEVCQKAKWGYRSVGRISYCCSHRMREATAQEYAEGALALKTII